ncbi:MAG TPA: hypothetical protein VFW33_05825 [Gemmataceae bacterium]|nr:hypothetical protein [Gemmataceae bacterium]
MPSAGDAAVAAESRRKAETWVVAALAAGLGAGLLKWGADLVGGLKAPSRSHHAARQPWEGDGPL